MDFYYWGIVNLFSLPYGDSIIISESDTEAMQFSPPCGDGTAGLQRYQVHAVFSPPYGDGTKERGNELWTK